MIDLPDRVPTEDQEQITVVQYCELHHLKFTAIPNHTWTPSQKQKRHNWQIGLRPGFTDMIVLTRSGMLCIEMKRRKGSSTSKDQKEWIDALQATPGIEARVCKGADEAIAFIAQYAGTPLPQDTSPF